MIPLMLFNEPNPFLNAFLKRTQLKYYNKLFPKHKLLQAEVRTASNTPTLVACRRHHTQSRTSLGHHLGLRIGAVTQPKIAAAGHFPRSRQRVWPDRNSSAASLALKF